MTIWKKAVSVGTTAALLASLLITVAAPSAFAVATVAGVGDVGRGSTSTNTATFTFSEETTACIYNALGGAGAPNAPIDVLVKIVPKDVPPVTGTVQFVGTPVLTAPGSLGAAASVVQSAAGVNDTLRIRIYGGDQFNKQQITVTGLKIKASSGASLGAIQSGLSSNDGNVLAACFFGATTTATGTVSAAIGFPSTSVDIAVSSTAPFAVTAGTSPGKLVFASGESVTVLTAGAVVGGIQTLTFTPATTVVHPANEAVSQASVPNPPVFPVTDPYFPAPGWARASIGNVTDSVRQDVWSSGGGLPSLAQGGAGAVTVQPENVYPGEQNNLTNSTYIYERPGSAGFIKKDTVLTFTIDAAGVLFSTSPSVKAYDAADPTAATTMTLDGQNASGVAVCNISFDRKSCTTKVTAVSTAPAAISLFNIKVDVDATVAKGTAVNINVTGVPVAVDYNTVAYVSRVIVGVAATPTIYINYNDQQSGMMSLTESGAGFFQDASVYLGNNVFGLCMTSGETFTRAPWAVVATGDLKLLSGLVGATSVQGTLFNGANCAYWTVFSASTVASTIDIRGSDSANAVLSAGSLNGPRLSVGSNLVPGATLVNILVGDKATVLAGNGVTAKVSNAVRAFKDSVVVTALSQPTIIRGTSSLAGNIKISETLAGQLKQGDWICLQIQPRASNFNLQDTWFDSSTTNQLPIVTPSGAGLLVGPVSVGGSQEGPCPTAPGGDNRGHAQFMISQQAVSALGSLTISNIHYITTADAPNGPVLVRVFHYSGTGVAFSTYINNAVIGVKSAIAISAVSALGLIPNQGPWSTSTKVAAANKFITWKFSGGAALAGKTVRIYVATKNSSGGWGPFVNLTGRVANASGVAEFHWRATGTWVSVRAYYAGDATYNASWSSPRQGRWLS